MERVATEGVRNVFFGFFGGPQQFDCWLNKIADLLADPAQCPPAALPPVIPPQYQDLMRRPHEVVDLLLADLEALGVFDEVSDGLARD